MRRYKVIRSDTCGAVIDCDDERRISEVVDAADYDALVAERDALRAQLDALEAEVEQACRVACNNCDLYPAIPPERRSLNAQSFWVHALALESGGGRHSPCTAGLIRESRFQRQQGAEPPVRGGESETN